MTSATTTWPKKASRTRSPKRCDPGHHEAYPPHRAPGSSPPHATAPSTGSDGPPSARPSSAASSSPPHTKTSSPILADGDIPDERLRLIFTGCHPAIARSDAVALTLRTVCGLSTPAIASAFLVKETTMQARITRAKAKIKKAKVPFRVPEHHELPDRLPQVLDVITLIYNQGYTPHDHNPLIDELRSRAIALADILTEHLLDEPEALGCLALLLFHETRQPARLDHHGNPRTPEPPALEP